MRFGLLQILLGCLLLSAGYLLSPLAWILAWPGLSVFTVGIAYLVNTPGVFGKSDKTGAHALWAKVLHAPYFLVAYFLWRVKPRLSKEPAFNKVGHGLYVGRRPANEAELPPETDLVVDLTSEFRRASATSKVMGYLCLPTLDTRSPDHKGLGELVESLVEHPGSIFVHCAMGHGRSVLLVAALLLARREQETIASCLKSLREARPAIHLRKRQASTLAALYPEL